MKVHGKNSSWAMRTLPVLLVLCSSPSFAQDGEGAADCTEESFRVTFEPVCPLMGDTEGMKYFEDVKHPVLTVEVAVPDRKPAHITASFGPSFPSPTGQKSKETLDLLRSVDLIAENLFPPAAGKEVTLHYGAGFMLESSPSLISLYVCQSANASGRCSDEPTSNQLTPHVPTFHRCSIPKVVTVPVWAGCR